jgi:MFS transporter, DHA3 family, macrolide efflux protein
VRIVVPLRTAPVALLWSGLSLSAIGDQLYTVALSWIAVRLLGTGAGYLAALQLLIVLLAVLGVGRWADHWDQRTSMVGADLSRAVILVAVVVAWLVSGAPSVEGLVCAILVLAIGQAVFQPALQAMLPSLVDDNRLLPAVNALLDATDRSARLLGPGLIALLAGTLPVVHFLTLDAVSFLASALSIMLIAHLRSTSRAFRRIGREGIWQAMTRGIGAMKSHPLLGYVLNTSGLLNGSWYAVFYLGLPLLIRHHNVRGVGGSGLGAFGLVIASGTSAHGLDSLMGSGRI